MEGGDDPEKSDAANERTMSTQVLEYYQKYSQNKQLPKYFCGSNANLKNPSEPEVPKLHSQMEQSIEQTSYPKAATRTDNLIPPHIIVDDGSDGARAVSPSSSVTSTKKLEWDSGADIGYENCGKQTFIQKSVSLPVLSKLGQVEFPKNILRLTPEGGATSSGSKIKLSPSDKRDIGLQYDEDITYIPSKNVLLSSSSGESHGEVQKNIVYLSSESSSLCYVPANKEIIISSSSSTENAKPVIMSSKDILQQVKKKVGYPLAESTPFCVERKSDPIIYSTPHIQQFKRSKIVNDLPVTQSFTKEISRNVQDQDGASILSSKKFHSTSFENLDSTCSISRSKKWKSQSDISMDQNEEGQKHVKPAANMLITTPIVVECVDYYKSSNKFVQTSLTRNISTAVQTDIPNSSKYNLSKENSPRFDNQNVFYVNHSDPQKELLASSCDSFEYVSGDDHNQNNKKKLPRANAILSSSPISSSDRKTTEEIEIQPAIKDKIQLNLKRSVATSNLINATSESDQNSSLSNTIPELGELISNKQSNQLIPDIERSITLLQKLTKSKKYDDVTKKYYLKKIVQKIVSSTYIDDNVSNEKQVSDGTASKTGEIYSGQSSDFPKSTSTDDDQPIQPKQNNTLERSLHDNIPWSPADITRTKQARYDQLKEFKIQTFASEFMPNFNEAEEKKQNAVRLSKSESIVNKELDRKQKRYQFTVSENTEKNQETAASSVKEKEFTIEMPPDTSNSAITNGSSVDNTGNKSKSNSSLSWREEKTLSEKLLEEKQLGRSMDKGDSLEVHGDHVLSFAKKERETQINWIKNEISHLSKLKKMLEKNKEAKDTPPNKHLEEVLHKPQISDFKGLTKSTAVYVITTEKTKGIDKDNMSQPAQGNANLKKDQVQNPNNLEHLDDNDQSPKPNLRSRSPSSARTTDQMEKYLLMNKPCFCKKNAQTIARKMTTVNQDQDPNGPKLISSQTYFTNQENACIRRYVFEIPVFDCVDCHCKDDELNLLNKGPRTSRPSSLEGYRRQHISDNVNFDRPKEHTDESVPGMMPRGSIDEELESSACDNVLVVTKTQQGLMESEINSADNLTDHINNNGRKDFILIDSSTEPRSCRTVMLGTEDQGMICEKIHKASITDDIDYVDKGLGTDTLEYVNSSTEPISGRTVMSGTDDQSIFSAAKLHAASGTDQIYYADKNFGTADKYDDKCDKYVITNSLLCDTIGFATNETKARENKSCLIETSKGMGSAVERGFLTQDERKESYNVKNKHGNSSNKSQQKIFKIGDETLQVCQERRNVGNENRSSSTSEENSNSNIKNTNSREHKPHHQHKKERVSKENNEFFMERPSCHYKRIRTEHFKEEINDRYSSKSRRSTASEDASYSVKRCVQLIPPDQQRQKSENKMFANDKLRHIDRSLFENKDASAFEEAISIINKLVLFATKGQEKTEERTTFQPRQKYREYAQTSCYKNGSEKGNYENVIREKPSSESRWSSTNDEVAQDCVQTVKKINGITTVINKHQKLECKDSPKQRRNFDSESCENPMMKRHLISSLVNEDIAINAVDEISYVPYQKRSVVRKIKPKERKSCLFESKESIAFQEFDPVISNSEICEYESVHRLSQNVSKFCDEISCHYRKTPKEEAYKKVSANKESGGNKETNKPMSREHKSMCTQTINYQYKDQTPDDDKLLQTLYKQSSRELCLPQEKRKRSYAQISNEEVASAMMEQKEVTLQVPLRQKMKEKRVLHIPVEYIKSHLSTQKAKSEPATSRIKEHNGVVVKGPKVLKTKSGIGLQPLQEPRRLHSEIPHKNIRSVSPEDTLKNTKLPPPLNEQNPVNEELYFTPFKPKKINCHASSNEKRTNVTPDDIAQKIKACKEVNNELSYGDDETISLSQTPSNLYTNLSPYRSSETTLVKKRSDSSQCHYKDERVVDKKSYCAPIKTGIENIKVSHENLEITSSEEMMCIIKKRKPLAGGGSEYEYKILKIMEAPIIQPPLECRVVYPEVNDVNSSSTSKEIPSIVKEHIEATPKSSQNHYQKLHQTSFNKTEDYANKTYKEKGGNIPKKQRSAEKELEKKHQNNVLKSASPLQPKENIHHQQSNTNSNNINQISNENRKNTESKPTEEVHDFSEVQENIQDKHSNRSRESTVVESVISVHDLEHQENIRDQHSNENKENTSCDSARIQNSLEHQERSTKRKPEKYMPDISEESSNASSESESTSINDSEGSFSRKIQSLKHSEERSSNNSIRDTPLKRNSSASDERVYVSSKDKFENYVEVTEPLAIKKIYDPLEQFEGRGSKTSVQSVTSNRKPHVTEANVNTPPKSHVEKKESPQRKEYQPLEPLEHTSKRKSNEKNEEIDSIVNCKDIYEYEENRSKRYKNETAPSYLSDKDKYVKKVPNYQSEEYGGKRESARIDDATRSRRSSGRSRNEEGIRDLKPSWDSVTPSTRSRPPSGRTEDFHGRSRPSSGRTEDIHGRSRPSSGRTEDIHGRSGPSSGRTENIHGRGRPSSGRTEDMHGRDQLSNRRAEDIHGRDRPWSGRSAYREGSRESRANDEQYVRKEESGTPVPSRHRSHYRSKPEWHDTENWQRGHFDGATSKEHGKRDNYWDEAPHRGPKKKMHDKLSDGKYSITLKSSYDDRNVPSPKCVEREYKEEDFIKYYCKKQTYRNYPEDYDYDRPLKAEDRKLEPRGSLTESPYAENLPDSASARHRGYTTEKNFDQDSVNREYSDDEGRKDHERCSKSDCRYPSCKNSYRGSSYKRDGRSLSEESEQENLKDVLNRGDKYSASKRSERIGARSKSRNRHSDDNFKRDSEESTGKLNYIREDEENIPQKLSADKEIQTAPSSSKDDKSKGKETASTSSSSYTSPSTSSSSTTTSEEVCRCCKQRAKVVPYNRPEQNGVTEIRTDYLCQPCNMQNRNRPFYNTPGHVCNCYTLVRTQQIKQIRQTVDNLNEMENQECTCRNKNAVCPYCSYKTKRKHHKKGVAYTLTFEETNDRHHHHKHRKKKHKDLEEVVIKIPAPPHKKKGKHHNRSYDSDSGKENSPNKKKKHHHHHHHHHNRKRKSLQDYLCYNRPDFVESVEQRRKHMIKLAYMREERCEKYKQLLAMSTGIPALTKNNKRLRMFTPKEMKEITEKNYKKLPEVQMKLIDHKTKQIKRANRLLADIFNRKLRENVLRGKLTLPSDVSVINLL